MSRFAVERNQKKPGDKPLQEKVEELMDKEKDLGLDGSAPK